MNKKMWKNNKIKNKLILQCISDGTWEWDIKEGKFYPSAGWKSIIEYDEENEEDADFWFSLIHKDDRKLVIDGLKSYFKQYSMKYEQEFRFKTKSNGYRWFQVKGRAIWNNEKRAEYMAGICIDITESKRAEQELKNAMQINEKLLREAIEYDKLKTEFFSNISHELKTPLNIILGAIQLLELIHKNLDEDSCACFTTFNKYMHSMKQNCYRLLRLINNLLDITRLDSGFISMNLKNYNIVGIVEDITLSVASYLESKDINLVFDTEVEEKLIACDADKIERIILNLLSNSVKFTRPGGTINVNIYEKEDSIQISVKDDGIGIPEDKLQIIFERFRQVDSTLTRAAEGSGIGLSLVKAIVEAHGGTISVISELGKGSEFIIELPSRIIDSDMIYSTENTTQEKVERISVEFSDIYS